MKEQEFTEWEVLETHTDINIASNREIELQKEYGYNVDKVTYIQTMSNQSNTYAHNKILSDSQCQEIIDKYIPVKYSIRKLAKEYNVWPNTIQHIIKKGTR